MKRSAKLPELLSPAGSFEALCAAIDAGADAVYFGGGAWNARALAKNFDREEMVRALRYCRLRGVASHVTLNTLLFDRELDEALDYARFLYENGVSAVISADTGLIRLLRERLPGLTVHASTQAAIHNLDGAREWARLGVRRVVLAREMSRADVAYVTENAPVETEVFLHGALCVCQSGQCLFSSLVGGRSGNRGLCAQPCRLPYDDGYPLSLRDLSLAGHIPELIESGVSSLKIEGRMKSPAYVYHTTAIFRRLLDEGRAADEDEMRRLRGIFCRGEDFSDAYFVGDVRRPMTGVRTEEQKQVSRSLAEPDVTPRPVPIEANVTILSDTPSKMTLKWQDVSATVEGETPMAARSAPLSEADVRARLCRMGGTDFCLREADLSLSLGAGLFLTAGQINGLRRAAVAALEQAITRPKEDGGSLTPPAAKTETETKKEKTDGPESARPTPDGGVVGAYAAASESARARDDFAVFYDPRVLPRLTEATRGMFSHRFVPLWQWDDGMAGYADGVLLPPVVFDHEWPEIDRLLADAARCGVRLALTAGVGQIAHVRAAGMVALGDFRWNVTNGETRRTLCETWGVRDVILSPELTLPQARDVGGRVIVYGRVPLMVLERCVTRGRGGCAGCGGDALTDRTGARFPVRRCFAHRNLLFNSLPTYMGDRRAALDAAGLTCGCFLFSVEDAHEIERVAAAARAGKPLEGCRRWPTEKV
ncbi:MAG: U32 family peptidase [Clostridia bacterium]|nr:U32 family peptidase [Clostridia bacterium]